MCCAQCVGLCCAQCEEEVEEGPYSAHALLTQQREPGVRPLPPSSLYQSPLVAVSLVIPVTLVTCVISDTSDTSDISDTSATSCGI